MDVVDGRKDVEGARLPALKAWLPLRVRVGAKDSNTQSVTFSQNITINHTNLSVDHWNLLSFHL
jgi:hypothetical protein